MSNTTMAIMFLLFSNILMGFANVIIQANPLSDSLSQDSVLYDCKGSFLTAFSKNKSAECYDVNTYSSLNNSLDNLPTSSNAGIQSGSTGNIFVDYISTTTAWLKSNAQFIGAFLSGPYVMISNIPLVSPIFANILAIGWYLICTMFIIFGLVLGRDI
jgi:hypothetical protein